LIMYNITTTKLFRRIIKKLSKKYPHIEKDYFDLLDKLEQGQFVGDEVQGFAGDVYKVRIASTDQKKGKSGGFRIIYYVYYKADAVYFMYIYAKSEKENIDPTIIERIKKEIEEINSL